MRKLPRQLDNPVDTWILDVVDCLPMDRMHAMGVTPNMITSVGNVFRAVAAYGLYNERRWLFAVTYSLGYTCDCLDGHFARRYLLTSEFGDVYDHVSDMVMTSPYVYWILLRASYPELASLLIMWALMCVHLGAQQRHVTPSNESLDVFERLCPDKTWIHWTRYFGCGTFAVYLGALTVSL